MEWFTEKAFISIRKVSPRNVTVQTNLNPYNLSNACMHTHARTHAKIRNLHCIQPQFHPHRHTPWWSWQQYPTSQAWSRWRGRPPASAPAAAYQQWGHRLKHRGRVIDIYSRPVKSALQLYPQRQIHSLTLNFQFSSTPLLKKEKKVSVKIPSMWFFQVSLGDTFTQRWPKFKTITLANKLSILL